jgi:hypothetical protein
MTAPTDDEAGWLTQFRRGAVAGVVVLLVAVVLAAIPTFVAWLAPGAESTPARSALRAAVILTVAANHGGLVLDGTSVTLLPLLPTLLLGWLLAVRARKPDTGTGFAGLVLGYTVATGGAAEWSRLGSTFAPALASMLAAAAFALLAGGVARYGPPAWRRVDERWRQILRAAAAASAVYLFAASAIAAAMLGSHLRLGESLQTSVAAGAAGLPVALIGVAAAPNAVLAVVGYLAGPGFVVGSHTSVSMFAVERGRLPTFPLLAGLPSGQPATIAGVGLGLLTALAAGGVLYRLVRTPELGVASLATDLGLSALSAGLGLILLVTAAGGGLGVASLHHVGATGWQVGGAVAVILLLSSLFWLGVDRLRRRLSGAAGAEATRVPISLAKAAARTVPAAVTRRPRADDGDGTTGRRLKSTG